MLFIGLIAGAGALISGSAYKRAKIADEAYAILPPPPNGCPPPPDDYQQQPEKVKGRDLKKAVEEAVKPHLERTVKLEKKLADAETLIKDLKVAAKLAPDNNEAAAKKKAGVK